ncbi:MAG: hypothetical protein LBJ92_00420 [Holosporales bacterium]|jgi:predicted DNA-binding protein|nr:hypothetical protein [Holosporales bacterium]
MNRFLKSIAFLMIIAAMFMRYEDVKADGEPVTREELNSLRENLESRINDLSDLNRRVNDLERIQDNPYNNEIVRLFLGRPVGLSIFLATGTVPLITWVLLTDQDMSHKFMAGMAGIIGFSAIQCLWYRYEKRKQAVCI